MNRQSDRPVSRLGRRRARRLLDGDPAARANQARLAELLDALAPETPARRSQVPPELLSAFAARAEANGAGHRPRAGARGRAQTRYVRRALTVKTAAVVLMLSGGGTIMAAAAADVLPGPAQRAAHELFGSWGVPAPSASPHGNDPQPPPPGTDPVLTGGAVPGGATSGASPSATDPDAKKGTNASGATPGAAACATRKHGTVPRRCDTAGSTEKAGNGSSSGDGTGDASTDASTGTTAPGSTSAGPIENPVAPSGSSTGSATPTPTRSTHTPPGRKRNADPAAS